MHLLCSKQETDAFRDISSDRGQGFQETHKTEDTRTVVGIKACTLGKNLIYSIKLLTIE